MVQMVEQAKSHKKFEVLKTLFIKNGPRWEVNSSMPLLKSKFQREENRVNKFRQTGRSRAVMEETLIGGSSVLTKCPFCLSYVA